MQRLALAPLLHIILRHLLSFLPAAQVAAEQQQAKDLVMRYVRIALAQGAQVKRHHLQISGQHLGQQGDCVKGRVVVFHAAGGHLLHLLEEGFAAHGLLFDLA